jgi:predicted protein tyrosine phosphatase
MSSEAPGKAVFHADDSAFTIEQSDRRAPLMAHCFRPHLPAGSSRLSMAAVRSIALVAPKRQSEEITQ